MNPSVNLPFAMAEMAKNDMHDIFCAEWIKLSGS